MGKEYTVRHVPCEVRRAPALREALSAHEQPTHEIFRAGVEFMMKRAGALLSALAVIVAAAAWRQGATKDQADIRAAIDNYFKGHATGDGSHFAKVFHPDSKLFWVGTDGTLMQRTSADYIKGASGKPAADEAQRKRRIESIDVAGNAAMVKVVLDYPATTFTDYMSMLKINGEWKIVNKTYVSQRK